MYNEIENMFNIHFSPICMFLMICIIFTATWPYVALKSLNPTGEASFGSDCAGAAKKHSQHNRHMSPSAVRIKQRKR